ncbi:MAG: beta-N-acetylhexosaminidase [Alphaproteobacteria bacterium]|nr:beta-N-acetylhexosaminidase [Alphaproteobacteria bacterium]
MPAPGAVIFGCEGLKLTEWERGFFAKSDPLGFILFARNCESPAQVKALVAELRASVGRPDAPILIDQEGGRVARLKPPHWRHCPPAGAFAAFMAVDKEAAAKAVYLNARLIAAELAGLGITVDCAPLADIPVPGAHDIIGDRAYGLEPHQVSTLARRMGQGLIDGGVIPVLKHIPGHGRATADSHESLPVVDADIETLRKTDFQPFKALKDLPWGMTAHILYTALDKERVATLSPTVIALIREELGFDGLLLSDDISMKALAGSFAERTKAVLDAGCDVVLHCNGKREEMEEIASAARPLTQAAESRVARAEKMIADARKPENPALAAEFETLWNALQSRLAA